MKVPDDEELLTYIRLHHELWDAKYTSGVFSKINLPLVKSGVNYNGLGNIDTSTDDPDIRTAVIMSCKIYQYMRMR